MESALLYTFSTIAQALGGAIALLAAFVLYRLQSLDKLMWECSGDLREAYPAGTQQIQHDQMRAMGQWRQILIDVQVQADESRRHRLPSPYGPKGMAPYTRLATSFMTSQGISRQFKTAAWATALEMVLSVAVLPFAHLLIEWPVLSWTVLIGVGVIGFSWCLWTYWRVVSVVLGFSELRPRDLRMAPPAV